MINAAFDFIGDDHENDCVGGLPLAEKCPNSWINMIFSERRTFHKVAMDELKCAAIKQLN